ncbi:MAG TPA: site-2 protease family protein [Gaiellaceae bacterium]|nr:site-2 protease family protein [Gaiellaceae bacterium]
MTDSLVLGRVFGIRIGVNWSWLVIAALLVWTLASSVFPDANPDLSGGTHAAMAVVAALLFFVSILLHELGHALQAKREHVRIEGITLWMLGGVAKMSGRVPGAASELRIAAAGPLVSLVLGLACVAAAVWLGLPEAADAVAAWLGYVNLALLVFNLLPAFPLDGGRILLAALWLASGDQQRAMRRTVAVSRVAAFGLIGAGAVLLVSGSPTGGIWLGFIGWFLLQAASAEAEQRTAEARLAGLRVRDLMTPDPVTVRPDMTLSEVVDDVVWKARYTTYPVVRDGSPVGLLPFATLAAVPRGRWDETRVEESMLPLSGVPVLSPDLPVAEALPEVGASQVRRALVLDGGRLAGILSIADLLRALEVGGPRR